MLREMETPPDEQGRQTRDPVCAMTVHPTSAKECAMYQGTTHYFCSAGCRSAFQQDPERYLTQEPAAAMHHGHEH